MANKKIGKYVVKCIKSNEDFGFGCKHRNNQYIMKNGRGNKDIQKAYIYNDDECCNECGLVDSYDWYEYYQFIPVTVIIKERK